MVCEGAAEIVGIGTVESVDTKEPFGPVNGVVEGLLPTRPTTKEPKNTSALSVSSSTSPVPVTDHRQSLYSSSSTLSTSTTTMTTTTTTTTTSRPPTRAGNVQITRTTTSPPKFNSESIHSLQQQPKHPLVLGSPAFKSKADREDIIVKDVLRQDNSVIIYWDTEAHNILGFRVIYRLFGDSSFKQAPPLEASEREFKIKNVPSQVRIRIRIKIKIFPDPSFQDYKIQGGQSNFKQKFQAISRASRSKITFFSVSHIPDI